LRSGFHERIHTWLPGIEEESLDGREPEVRPLLLVPSSDTASPEEQWFTCRDREEELVAVARRIDAGLRSGDAKPLDRAGVVFKKPLPYLYLAPGTLGAAGIAFQTADALPLAAEPAAAALDLVLDAVETDFSPDAVAALQRSPHFSLDGGTGEERIRGV